MKAAAKKQAKPKYPEFTDAEESFIASNVARLNTKEIKREEIETKKIETLASISAWRKLADHFPDSSSHQRAMIEVLTRSLKIYDRILDLAER